MRSPKNGKKSGVYKKDSNILLSNVLNIPELDNISYDLHE